MRTLARTALTALIGALALIGASACDPVDAEGDDPIHFHPNNNFNYT